MALQLSDKMNNMRSHLSFTVFLIFFCSTFLSAVAQQSNKEYKKEIEQWDLNRLESVKSPTGWVNLAGLYWLNPGRNNFGSASTNELVYSKEGFPAMLGTFELTGNTVKWGTANGQEVWHNTNKVTDMVVFHVDSSSTPSLAYSTYRWSIIKREDKIGVRFRDLNNLSLAALTHINRFDVDSKWRINAYLEQSMLPTVAITNVLGQTYQQSSPGKIVFELNGKTYKLDAVDELLFNKYAECELKLTPKQLEKLSTQQRITILGRFFRWLRGLITGYGKYQDSNRRMQGPYMVFQYADQFGC